MKVSRSAERRPALPAIFAALVFAFVLTNRSAFAQDSVNADAGPDQTVECTSRDCTPVTLDGTGSSQVDGQPLTFTWTGPFGIAAGPTPEVFLPLGGNEITLTVTDGEGNADTDTVVITVEDTTPPLIKHIFAGPDVLWPPNHRMVDVNVIPFVLDACDPLPACEIVSIESNEPENGQGDGNTAPDFLKTGPLSAQLRAERAGPGDGRVYTLTVRCTDDSGNSSTDHVRVVVPHDQGGNAGDNRTLFGGTYGYRIVCAADLNHDGYVDVLFQGPGGDVVVVFLHGDNSVSYEHIKTVLPATGGYVAVAIGDVNHDGYADVIFQGPGGDVVVLYLKYDFDYNLTYEAEVIVRDSLGYRVVCAADINNDGYTDLLFQRPGGDLVCLDLKNRPYFESGDIKVLARGTLGFRIICAADINNDGYTDLLFQGPFGNLVVVELKGKTAIKPGDIKFFTPGASIPGYAVVCVADVNGDGCVDLFLRGPGGDIIILYLD